MDLLNMLMGSMATDDSLSALTKKTGASKEQTEKLLASALPLLVGSMTNNAAASQQGADSLRSALTQHTSTKKAAEQIKEADLGDGEKIVRHILGDNSDKVVQTLALETDMNQEQVTRGLASMAPLLLSILSAVTGKAAKFDLSDGLDLTDILALFGGSQQSAANGLGMLGSLLGMGSSQSSGSALGGLMGSLLGGGGSQQASGGNLLGSLLGGGASQQAPSGNLLGSLLGGGASQSGNAGGGLGSLIGSVLGASNNKPSANTVNGGDLLSILLGRK